MQSGRPSARTVESQRCLRLTFRARLVRPHLLESIDDPLAPSTPLVPPSSASLPTQREPSRQPQPLTHVLNQVRGARPWGSRDHERRPVRDGRGRLEREREEGRVNDQAEVRRQLLWERSVERKQVCRRSCLGGQLQASRRKQPRARQTNRSNFDVHPRPPASPWLSSSPNPTRSMSLRPRPPLRARLCPAWASSLALRGSGPEQTSREGPRAERRPSLVGRPAAWWGRVLEAFGTGGRRRWWWSVSCQL